MIKVIHKSSKNTTAKGSRLAKAQRDARTTRNTKITRRQSSSIDVDSSSSASQKPVIRRAQTRSTLKIPQQPKKVSQKNSQVKRSFSSPVKAAVSTRRSQKLTPSKPPIKVTQQKAKENSLRSIKSSQTMTLRRKHSGHISKVKTTDLTLKSKVHPKKR